MFKGAFVKKSFSLFCSIVLGLTLLSSTAEASSVKGKIFYAKTLKTPCGYTGEIMGKKYTVAEWRSFYNDKSLNAVIKVLCPKAPEITDEKDLTNLYHFLSSFASDSGNVPSCN